MAEVRQNIPIHMQFILSGCSGMSACLFVHPLDLLKNRMQLSDVGSIQRKTLTQVSKQIYKTEGLRTFYTGLTAGLLRQATYGSCRIGIYLSLNSYYKENHGNPEFYIKVAMGCTSGIAGALVGTPSELILVRMTADGTLPLNQRRNYSNALSALIRIIQEEKLTTLWRGLGPTMNRAIVANAAELSAYSQSKSFLLTTAYFQDNINTHVICSIVAALANLSFSMPFDIIKTRIQNTTQAVSGSGLNPLIILTRIVKEEGMTAIWKGFLPSFACIAPRTILVFVFVEYLSSVYKRTKYGSISVQTEF